MSDGQQQQGPTPEQLIAWSREAAENHEDWAKWFRIKPDDPRVETHGDSDWHDYHSKMHSACAALIERLRESEAHWRQTSKMLVNTARPLASMVGANSSYDAIQAVDDELQATETPNPERNPDEQD